MAYATYIWLTLVVLMFVCKFLSSQPIFIWLSLSGFCTLIVSMICHNFLLEIFIFIVVCTVILFVAKPIVKRMISFNEEKTNARRFVNKKAVVVSEINNRTGAGQVSIGGEIWSCSSLDDSSILPGETVLIKGLRGVRLIVRHVASN